MAEPIPSASSSAAAEAADKDEETGRLPKNAEDRKAAAALNSLNANEISQDDGAEGASSKQPSAADQEALGKAMSRLEIAGGTGAAKKDAEKKAGDKKAGVDAKGVKKKVKIASEDVNLLVDELDLSKTKATELLKAHEGDATKAIRAFIVPPSAA